MSDADAASMPTGEPVGRVTLVEGRARPLWAGHPLVYAGAIASVDGTPSTGDAVAVADSDGRLIGVGVWHAEAVVRVRLLRSGAGVLDQELIGRRVRRAAALRTDVLKLPARTDAWRLVHGDGDGLNGAVADRFGAYVVLQVTTLAAAQRRPWLAAALMDEDGVEGVWERPSPRFATAEGFHAGGGRLAGTEPPEEIEIVEDGVRYGVDLRKGQKTGHFLDQRDNRRRFAEVASAGRVLDLFAGTGGFGLAAAVAGATSVLAVDVSARALARLTSNAARNDATERVALREEDAFSAVRALTEEKGRFDAVSVDPPRMASSRGELKGALRGYRDLNAHAISLVTPGGFLATSSCTGALTEDAFLRMLRDAALRARRRLQVLHVSGQAPDHPWLTAVPEGRYLKHVLARVV